jgi:phage terminase large subunit GpA-like protein
VVTAGVDVQLDRWEITAWGWGRGEEGWVIDHTVLHGNPAVDSEWDGKLLPYLEQTFQHVGGSRLRIHASAVDTGGNYTHQAYSFVRRHQRLRVHAVKGDSAEGKPVKGRSSLQDINHRGQVIKRGVRLWLVGVDTAKDLLHGRLGVETTGPGYVHFSHELDDEFFAQLTAEHRVPIKTARGTSYRWVKRRQRNEALDCSVYAVFAAHAADLHRYTDRHWAQLEQMLQPTLFDGSDPAAQPALEATPPPPAAPAPTKPRRGPRIVGRFWR